LSSYANADGALYKNRKERLNMTVSSKRITCLADAAKAAKKRHARGELSWGDMLAYSLKQNEQTRCKLAATNNQERNDTRFARRYG
jgi:hypothetical protein